MAAASAVTVPSQVSRTAVAAVRAPAVTEADAAHPTCRVSLAAVACTPGEAGVPRRQDEAPLEPFQSRATQAWLRRLAVAAARSLAASPADAWPARAGVPVVGPSLAPRFEGESSAARSVPRVPAAAAQRVTRPRVRAAVLRLSLR